ncbi:lysoplasmalogenase [Desulfocicer niacini]
MNVLILIGTICLLGGLLLAEKQESIAGKLITKTPLSMLFVLVALIQPRPDPFYYRLMTAGFILSLLGDILLVFYQMPLFRAGLVSFLLAHVFFTLALLDLGSGMPLSWLLLCGVIVVAGGCVYVWLKPHLGNMKYLAMAYMVVISCMLASAGRVLFDSGIPGRGRAIVLTGALLFYLSDLFVARNRFVEKSFINRLIGLPLYYAAQFFLAFSVGLVG